MSSRLALGFAILASIPALHCQMRAAEPQTSTALSIPDLLRAGEIAQAEALLNREPDSAATTALRGEVAYRKGSFAEAETLYKRALDRDSKTARAHFGMGKLALAKLKSNDALQAFRKAIELDPKQPVYHIYASEAWGGVKNAVEQQKELETYVALETRDSERLAEARAGVEMLKAFRGVAVGSVEAPVRPAPIRIRKSLNLLFVDAMVNGQGPFSFVLDTGATTPMLSSNVAAKLGLQPITSTVVHGVGGSGTVDTRIFRVDSIQLGDVKVKNLPAGAFEDPLLTQLADGVLGTAIFSDFLVTVNYPESRLELSKDAPASAAAERIPVWSFANLFLVPLEINGKSGNFVVDTGAAASAFAHSMAAKLGVTENTPNAKIDLPFGGIGGINNMILRVPDVTMKTPKSSEQFDQVLAIDLGHISKMMETEVSGLVGFDFLSNYTLTVDYGRAEIRLEKRSPGR